MLISCLFLGAADCFGEVGPVGNVRRIFCLDNAHAGHTKNYCCPINYWPDKKIRTGTYFLKQISTD